jgi:hypothetical protein
MFSFYALPREWKSPRVVVLGIVVCYLILVRALRYRRRDGLMRAFKRKYGSCSREALSKMTVEDSWTILKELTELEFPSIFSASVFFALFKVRLVFLKPNPPPPISILRVNRNRQEYCVVRCKVLIGNLCFFIYRLMAFLRSVVCSRQRDSLPVTLRRLNGLQTLEFSSPSSC